MQDVVELPAQVYRKIIRHCLKGLSALTKNGAYRYNRWNEVIGALIGKFKTGKVEIVDAIELGEGTSTYVLATDYARIFEKSNLETQLLQDRENRVSICGWYHSHPGYGFFLSGTDKRTQTTYQQQHAQAIALVADPTTIFHENDSGIRVFRIQDHGIFGPSEVQLDVMVVGLEQEFRETLRNITEELGLKQLRVIFPPEPLVTTTSAFLSTPPTAIQVIFSAPERVAVGDSFPVTIGVEGIEIGVIQLSYDLILPEQLSLLSQPWQNGYASHAIMTNGTVRVFRVRTDIEAAFDIVLDNIVVSTLYESVSLGRQELTVIAT